MHTIQSKIISVKYFAQIVMFASSFAQNVSNYNIRIQQQHLNQHLKYLNSNIHPERFVIYAGRIVVNNRHLLINPAASYQLDKESKIKIAFVKFEFHQHLISWINLPASYQLDKVSKINIAFVNFEFHQYPNRQNHLLHLCQRTYPAKNVPNSLYGNDVTFIREVQWK